VGVMCVNLGGGDARGVAAAAQMDRSRIERAGGWITTEKELCFDKLKSMELEDPIVRKYAEQSVKWVTTSRVNAELSASRVVHVACAGVAVLVLTRHASCLSLLFCCCQVSPVQLATPTSRWESVWSGSSGTSRRPAVARSLRTWSAACQTSARWVLACRGCGCHRWCVP
jgi:hypothetical protein